MRRALLLLGALALADGLRAGAPRARVGMREAAGGSRRPPRAFDRPADPRKADDGAPRAAGTRRATGGIAGGRAGGGGGDGARARTRPAGAGVGTVGERAPAGAPARAAAPRAAPAARGDAARRGAPARFERRPRQPREPKAPPEPSCYGCGATLHDEYDDAPGYVDSALLATKRLHRQLDSVLCSRCRLLAQGEFVPVVREGSTQLAGNRAVVSPQELRDQLKGLADRAALIVKLVDMADVSGSFLSRVRSLIGRNPLVLVGTKADLLPRGTDGELVRQWLLQLAHAHSLNVIDVHLVSSRTGDGVETAVRAILGHRKGRDVFVLGAANVGKSLFVQAFLRTMAERDPIGVGMAQRYQPLASATPGTTLGIIALDVFSGGSRLHDTPGVHLHHRVSARLPPDDIKAVAVRQQLRGVGAPVCAALLAQLAAGVRARDLERQSGWSVLWGGFLRVDVVSAPPSMRLVFFGPRGVALHGVETEAAGAFRDAELGRTLTPPSSADAARALGELEEKRSLAVRVVPGERALDVAVSGLGWFAVVGVGQSGLGGESQITLFSPRAVELFVRKPMPVPWAGFHDHARSFVALKGTDPFDHLPAADDGED